MEKVDFKKTMASYRAKVGQFDLINVSLKRYLEVDGQGNPNDSVQFQEALQMLYPIAYKTKFVSKVHLGRDYVVPPLEGLWWADDMQVFHSRDKDLWQWTMMLMLPSWVPDEMVEQAKTAAASKNPSLD